jgi:predicted TIM-barrel fold metal-dependent hydrolase
MIEYGTDTTRVIASLTFAGTAARFSGITWVFSHAGGVMPYLIERFFQAGASAEVVPGVVTRGQAGRAGGAGNTMSGDQVLAQLRRFYYDTAQASNPVAMDALKKVATPSQIVFGTDYWYRTAEETGRGLITSRVFSESELSAINRGNAERLLPRYRA